MNKPWKKLAKTIKAPPYFKDTQDRIDRIEKEVSKMLGVGPEWLKQHAGENQKQFAEIINEFAVERGWSEHDRYKVKCLLSATSTFIEYSWVRFVLEHIDDIWGKANPDTLSYNTRTDEIVMKWLLPKIKRPIRAIAKRLKRKKRRRR